MLEYHRFRQVYDLFMKGREADAKEELAELQGRYVALCDENTSLKMQLQEYEDILYLARNLVFDGNFYWLITGSIRQGPFCPSCYDREGLLMRLSGEPPERFCSSCRAVYPQAREVGGYAVAVAHDWIDSGMEHELPSAPKEKCGHKARVIPFRRGV